MSKIDLGMDFQMPKHKSSQIKVMGIGGGGSNAVNYMFLNGITGVDFVVCNTDSQALEASPVPIKIQLGANLTEGLGAGSNPDIGKKAAEESADKIVELLDANTKMLFLTAGMGGGTGTGAAPVIAEIAREKGILSVGVVTNPFSTEGGYRKKYAEEGVEQLKKFVDTLLIINNDKLIEVYGDLTFTQAFGKANEVLNTATKGIAEVISQHLLVNIDLNDARKVLENSGTAVMGQSEAEGENRAIEAVIGALDSPLLNDNDITGAQQVLLKIVTGEGEGELRMSELAKIKQKIQEAAGSNVNIIEGIGINSELGNSVSVTVIATGFEQKRKPKIPKTISLADASALEDKTVEELTIEKKKLEDVIDSQQILELDDLTTDAEAENFSTELGADDISVEAEAENFSTELASDEISVDAEAENFSTELASDEISTELDESLQINNEVNMMSELKSEKIVFELEEENNGSYESSSKEDDIDLNEPDNATKINTFENASMISDNVKVESREREGRLREISQQLRTPSGLTKLEDIPAYKRNNIELDQDIPVSSEDASKITLNDEGENKLTINENNSFLHDNVD